MLTRNGVCLDRRSARLIAGLIFLLTVTACGGGGDNEATPDTTPPTVSATSPANNATGVTTNASVSATFSEAMNNATLTTTSFTLATTIGGAPVAGTVSVTGDTATFDPTASLAGSTQYTATITTTATDAAGNALLADYSWNFTTATGTSYTTSFLQTENPISEGGIWTNGLAVGLDWNDLKTENGNCVGASDEFYLTNRYGDDIGHLKKSFIDFADNQYAQATVYKAPGYTGNGGSHEVELLLRFEIRADSARGYEVLWGITNTFAIVRWNGVVTDYTPLLEGQIGTPVDGDVLRAEISGTTITVLKNGAQVAQVTDATFSEGQPGIGFWPVDGAIAENMGWKDFTAGSLP